VPAIRIVEAEDARVDDEGNEAGERDADLIERGDAGRAHDAEEFPRAEGRRNREERREGRSSVHHDGDRDGRRD
jgi:hypothetical protein